MIIILIILLTGIFSYRGFIDHGFFNKYAFSVERIEIYKEYICLITSGLLHVNWMHLIFNMLALYLFSGTLMASIGGAKFLLIYVASLVGGNLLALWIHRHQNSYSSVGASGAVNGIIYASIALFPSMRMGFFFIPISFPIWIYGIIFVAISIYGIRSGRDNVGHESHLGGAVIGMFIALILYPEAITVNYLPVLIILLPSLAFIYIIIYKPQLLLVNNLFYNKYKYTIDQRYNLKKAQEQTDIDAILEKIHRKGMKSLTKAERKRLEEYSKNQRT